MKEKLEYLLREKQLSATSLARLLDIQPSGISHIMSGRNKPSFDLVVKILSVFPDINPDWLLLDSDEVYRRDQQPRTNNPLFDFDVLDGSNVASGELSQNNASSVSNSSVENVQMLNFQPAKNLAKDVVRIVVLYGDGTFESFSSR